MIGDILRKERENQSLSIQDVEKGTSIRALYIEALEQGEYDKLPGEVYAKGFIKNYGNFLNLDGDDLVKKFIMEISPTMITPDENNSADKSAAVKSGSDAETSPVTKTRSQRRAESNASSDDDSRRKYIYAAIAVIGILLGGIMYSFSGGDENSVAGNEDAPPVESQQVAQVTPEVQPPTPVVEPPPVVANDVNVQATFSGDCWTQVAVDGAVVFEGVINAGQVFDWTGNQSVNVVLGNAGAVNFVMNGQNIGALGADGAVVERTFTR